MQGITSVKEKTSNELRETINDRTSSFPTDLSEAAMPKHLPPLRISTSNLEDIFERNG
jgi:hypothetical protein